MRHDNVIPNNFKGRTLEGTDPACTRVHLLHSRPIHTLNI